ncbi:MAG: division/cell wall cluster transcriptional repressor MraZ [Clostridia bacterium]|jgi:MraZ protein|nr:division/cell wall cluster transcriptional repressor MraZ [Clostridia bacterium]
MFIGEYQHSIDAKGRIIVPSKLRCDLGERFVLTKGLDNCLFIYTLEEWKNFEEKLKALPLTNINARKFVRFFFAGAVECEADKQGRILIPNNLREYAELLKETVFIGVSNRVEVWNKENWESYNDSEEFDANEIAEHMVELGI